MTRPGAAARALLGGDERLHVFVDSESAAAYASRIPGARTFAPSRKGWGNVLHDAIVGAIRCRDLTVQLEWDRKGPAEALLEIAIVLYDRGAYEVYDHNGHLIRAVRRQWR